MAKIIRGNRTKLRPGGGGAGARGEWAVTPRPDVTQGRGAEPRRPEA